MQHGIGPRAARSRRTPLEVSGCRVQVDAHPAQEPAGRLGRGPLARARDLRSFRGTRMRLRAWDARSLGVVFREKPDRPWGGASGHRSAWGRGADARTGGSRLCDRAGPFHGEVRPPCRRPLLTQLVSHRASSRRAADAAWPPVPRRPAVASELPRNAHHLEPPRAGVRRPERTPGMTSPSRRSSVDVRSDPAMRRRDARSMSFHGFCVPFEVFRALSPPPEGGASPARPKPVRA